MTHVGLIKIKKSPGMDMDVPLVNLLNPFAQTPHRSYNIEIDN